MPVPPISFPPFGNPPFLIPPPNSNPPKGGKPQGALARGRYGAAGETAGTPFPAEPRAAALRVAGPLRRLDPLAPRPPRGRARSPVRGGLVPHTSPHRHGSASLPFINPPLAPYAPRRGAARWFAGRAGLRARAPPQTEEGGDPLPPRARSRRRPATHIATVTMMLDVSASTTRSAKRRRKESRTKSVPATLGRIITVPYLAVMGGSHIPRAPVHTLISLASLGAAYSGW